MKALTDKIIDELIEEKNDHLHEEQYCDGITYAISTIQELEKDSEFDEVARVMMRHLANPQKYHPHHRAIIDSTNAELLEGKESTGKVMDYITN
jgi:hypothetical protein